MVKSTAVEKHHRQPIYCQFTGITRVPGTAALAVAEESPQPTGSEDLTLDQLFDLYIQLYASRHTKRPGDTAANYHRYFSNFKERRVSTIARMEVQNWVNDLADQIGKHTANRNFDILRAVINWGIKKEIIPQRNPCLGVDTFKLKARERFVQPGNEYEKLQAAIDAEKNPTIRDFFWLCLYTGARKSNIKAMRWQDISFEFCTWKIPASATKNGDSLNIPLSAEAMAVLHRRRDNGSEWVFPGRFKGHLVSVGKAWKRITRRADLADVRIHDLRRTLGSHMAIQGISPIIIGRALGHRSLKSTAVYARLNDAPVRDAIARAIASYRSG